MGEIHHKIVSRRTILKIDQPQDSIVERGDQFSFIRIPKLMIFRLEINSSMEVLLIILKQRKARLMIIKR